MKQLVIQSNFYNCRFINNLDIYFFKWSSAYYLFSLSKSDLNINYENIKYTKIFLIYDITFANNFKFTSFYNKFFASQVNN